ncbi:hypothetical protein J42TS3_08720 [Paenibacillus vini]|uniref:Uncharacterized protein n=1 Tax=Paenibacillus vini TaxID=1476024 RepID=A0ABQ4M858_9BACL|nr:hypothetical protein J42TS3_08720 [Paenibacillus vini]
MGTSYDAYNIRTDGFVRTKNSGMGAIRVKKTRRNVPVGMTASIEYHTKLPARPRIDTVENYDIRPIKHSNAFTEVSFSLEYGGRLPKRPRI